MSNLGINKLRNAISKLSHVLYGVLTVFVPPYLAPIFAILFVIYELDEDWHISDEAYRDILDYMIGLSVASVIRIIFCVYVKQ